MAKTKLKAGQLVKQNDVADVFYPEQSGVCMVLSVENEYCAILTPNGTKVDVEIYLAVRRFNAINV